MTMVTKSYAFCTENELTETSVIYKILAENGDNAIKNECWNHTPETVKKLEKLLNTTLTAKSCLPLLRPIVRAQQLAGVIGNIDIQARKKVNKRLIRYATAIKNDLEKAAHEPDTIRLFMQQIELDYAKLSQIIDEYITHQHFLCGLHFRNGKTLNPNNLKRYGIYCLFHIGEKINLSKDGKPSPLYQFIEIATGLDYKAIGEIYRGYKKVDVVKESESSPALRFIYDSKLNTSTNKP